MKSFKLGINLAGAVSAGAYTAGVVDFLIEALDEWYAAKERGEPVPQHDVSLEVFSGASAGGMCAAIAAVQVQEEFEHIHDTSRTGTTNRFYESWVNRIDIRELLKIRDLAPGRPVASLLDSTIIGEIADYALTPGPLRPRKYVSPSLTVYLSLTNLRGVPYSLKSSPGSLEETISYFGDRLRFETVQPGASPSVPVAKPLPAGQPDQGAWPLLQSAAKATGAFPLFLSPQELKRDVDDYTPPVWEPLCPPPGDPQPKPHWPFEFGRGESWQTLNVDGGVTDNDPFQLAHDYLATVESPPDGCVNPSAALEADRAVLTVAPLPADDDFDPEYRPADHSGVLSVGVQLFSTLISQSRFFGESLAMITTGTVFSRFVIAPTDPALPGKPALQCAVLGAFGGFFDRGFRAHDYSLGRRNCQQFLRRYFILPEGNPVIRDGLASRREEVLKQCSLDPPNTMVEAQGQRWVPIIPLCGTALVEVPRPPRARITEADLDEIVDLIAGRFKALFPRLTEELPSTILRWLLNSGGRLVALFGKGKLREYLGKQLAG